MGYKYPNSAVDVDSIIADVVATVAWIDLVLQLKLAHIKYPVKLNSKVPENIDLFEKFQNHYANQVAKLSYREKIDAIFDQLEFENKQYRKDIKTLMIELGKIRNKVAHNAAISLVDKNFNLQSDSVGAHMINTNYDLFNEIFKRVEYFVTKTEESME